MLSVRCAFIYIFDSDLVLVNAIDTYFSLKNLYCVWGNF